MLAKRLDSSIEAYGRRTHSGSPVYRQSLKRRRLSIHARFVAAAFDVFPGGAILENIPAASGNEEESRG